MQVGQGIGIARRTYAESILSIRSDETGRLDRGMTDVNSVVLSRLQE